METTIGFNAGVEYTDNVNTSENDPKEDVSLILGPTISGAADMPILFSGGQRFTLSLSASYTKSLTGNKADSFGAPIAATLELPFYVAGWTVSVTDGFNFTNDPLESTFGVNRTKVTQYNNIASLGIARRFGKIGLSLGASRQDQIFPDDPLFEQTVYSFSVTPSYYLGDNFSIFLRNSYVITLPADPARPDVTGYSSEVGVSGQLTPNLSGSVSVGYAHSHVEPTATSGEDNIDGISSTISLTYAKGLRPNTSHTISFFRSPGVTAALQNSNVTETMGITYSITHQLTSHLALSPQIQWTHLRSVSGSSSETADVVSYGLNLTRAFSKHLTGTFGYNHQSRSSNLPLNSYEVNRINAFLTYTF